MIEKLDRHIKTEENGVRISCPPDRQDMMDKINELVDAVNDLQTRSENVQKDTESRSENVQDPVCFISTTYPSDNKTTVFF